MKLEAPGPLRFRRVHMRPDETRLKELHDSVLDLVDQLDRRFAAAYFQGIPINVPFPFRAGAFASSFKMDERFILCDGRRIVDADSPLNGQDAPVLADALGGSETLTWYIRIKD